MRRTRLAKKHTPIDKSALAIPVVPRLVDEAYRRSAEHQTCLACLLQGLPSAPGTVVLCHLNLIELGSGAGRKSDDSLGLFLCAAHHDEFDGRAGSIKDRCRWLAINILAPLFRRAHARWRDQQNQPTG